MDRIRELLQKYQQKTILPDEREELLDALRTGTYEQYEPWMDEVWQQLSAEGKPHPEAARRVYARLQNELFQRPTSQWRRAPWLKVAAALLLALGLAYYLMGYRASQRQIATGPNETRTLVLPDASVVTLNVNSELRYAATWDEEHPREVWLTGEAYFSVQHTALHQKFTVYTGEVAVEVLGTKFNVNNRHGENKILLEEGSIRLDLSQIEEVPPENSTMLMKPGEYVELSLVHKQFVKKAINPTQLLAWTEGKLIMDNTPLREVAQSIKDYYGLTVKFEDEKLADKMLTGSVPTDNIEDLLKVLSEFVEIHQGEEENALIFYNKDE